LRQPDRREAILANYWGLDAIAKRLNVNRSTLLTWHRDRGFLMYKRRRSTQDLWFTNDALILAWERDECARQARFPRRQNAPKASAQR